MKNFTPTLLCAALALAAFPADAKPGQPSKPGRQPQAAAQDDVRLRNTQATRQYYNHLVHGPQLKLAEISMLMTMMPKGGELHLHYSGAIYAETYLDWVEKLGHCVYREDSADGRTQKFRIKTQASDSAASKAAGEGKASPDAKAAEPLCLKADAVRNDPHFYRAVLSKWSALDYSNHFHPQLPPDQHFFDTFGYFGAVSGHATNEGLRHLKKRAKAENLQYMELMLKGAPSTEDGVHSARLNALPPDADGPALEQVLADYAAFLERDPASLKKIDDYVKMLADDAEGIDDDGFTLRLQSYANRNSAPSRVFSSLHAAFASSQRNPLLVGINFLSNEDGPVALRDYGLHMRMFQFLKKRFPATKLSLHAGELAHGLVPPEHLRSHIREAVEVAGASRIGHGTDIAHETGPDSLLATMKARQIAVEVNLTSAEFILGVKGGAHPLELYQRFGVPIVLSSDDPGLSRGSISGEYALFASRHQPSYDNLKQVVYNSIRYSFLNPTDKAAQLRLLDQRFTQFEGTVARMVDAANGVAGKR